MLLMLCATIAAIVAVSSDIVFVSGVNVLGVLSGATIFLGMQVFNGWRWQQNYSIVVDDVPLKSTADPIPSLGVFVRIIFLGNLVSLSILPSFVGQDATKLSLYRWLGTDLKRVTQSIVLSRLSGLSGILIFGIVGLIYLINAPVWDAINRDVFGYGLGLEVDDALVFIIAGLIGLIISILCWRIIRRQKFLNSVYEFVRFLRWRVFLSALVAQLMLIASSAVTIMAVGPIEFLEAWSFASVSALAKIIPFSLLGLTLGEGVLVGLLMAVGWGADYSIMAAGLMVAFLYLTASIAFSSELLRQAIN